MSRDFTGLFSVYGFTGAQVGKLPCLEISQVCFLCTDYGGPSGETAVSRDFTGLFSVYGLRGPKWGNCRV